MERFEQKVLTTAEAYIKKNRWSDAVQLIRYVEQIQESSPGGLISSLISKILKDSLALPDLHKTLRIYQEVKVVVEESSTIPVTDKCSVYNNLACTYKNLGNVIQAKKYSEKACSLSLTAKFPFPERAAVHLNLVSILSEMKKHEKAAAEAFKIVEGFSRFSSLSENLQKLFANACFHYATQKVHLKDLHEACKFFKKTVSLLEKLPEMQEMLKEAQQAFLSIQNEVYQKPRPVSANFKQKGANRIERPKREDSSRASSRKSSHYLRPGSGAKLVSNEMLHYKKEIERIIARPPLYEKKVQLKIASQSGIRVLPTRSEPDRSFVTPSSQFSVLHNESGTGMSRTDNVSQTDQFLSFEEVSPVKKESFVEVFDEANIIFIQSCFRGFLCRKNLRLKKSPLKNKYFSYHSPCHVLLSAWKQINSQYLFVLVYQISAIQTLEIFNIQLKSLVFRTVLNDYQVKNLEAFLNTLEFDSNHKLRLPETEKPKDPCFKHVQRSLRKVGEEDLILDCFSNERNEVLIKGKSVKSQKEFSVKVQKGFSSKKDIEEKIVPKLKIKEEVLVLSESLESLPLLLYEGEKISNGTEISVKVYLKGKAFGIFVKDVNDGSMFDSEYLPLRTSRSFAEDVGKRVEIKGKEIYLNEEQCLEEDVGKRVEIKGKEIYLNEEQCLEEDLGKRVEIKGKEIYLNEEQCLQEIEKNSDMNFDEKSHQSEKKESQEESPETVMKVEDSTQKSKFPESLEKTTEKILTPRKTQSSSSKISSKNDSESSMQETNLDLNPVKSFESSSESQVSTSPLTLALKIPIDPSSSKSSLSLENEKVFPSLPTSNPEEELRLDFQTTFEINKNPFDLNCKVFKTFLKIEAKNASESFTVFLKSLILEGYPEDCPLKRILMQNVFPRLYFKDHEKGKLLTCSQKFLIDSPSDLSRADPVFEFVKNISGQEVKVKIFRKKKYFLVANDKNCQVFWIPFKIQKNFQDESMFFEFVEKNIDFIESKKFGIFEIDGKKVFSLFNQEISDKEFAVLIKKEEAVCFVEACRPDHEFCCSLFLQGEMYDEIGVLFIARSLKVMKVREDYSLISELV